MVDVATVDNENELIELNNLKSSSMSQQWKVI